jgi:hypothetical protein
VAFFHRAPGLAFLHRLVLGIPLVCTEVGACGMRLVCLLVQRTGLDRFVAASSGAPHQVNRQVEEAIVAYRREESARLAPNMPATDLTVAQDATCTGGLCLVAMDPKSHSILLEQAAPARDQDTWPALMEQALSGLHGHSMQSTSDEAPALLAYVAHHLGAHHSPDLFHVQHELSTAVSAPMAATHRAAAQVVATAEERLTRVHAHLDNTNATPEKRGPGRLPKGVASLEQVEQDREAARQEHQRLSAQREQVLQSLRAIGHAYHFVELNVSNAQIAHELDVDLSDAQQMTTQLREGMVKKSQKSSCLLKWNVMKRMWLLAIKAILLPSRTRGEKVGGIV